MPPKIHLKNVGSTPISISKLKSLIDARKKQEMLLKKQQDDEEKRIQEEEQLLKHQKEIERKQYAISRQIKKEQQIKHREDEKKQHNIEILERMHQAGMIVPGHTSEIQKQGATKKIQYVNQEKIQEKKVDTCLRAPILCFLGHVDTGKTSLLDYIRNTTVQKNEHNGITQQIGASFFPHDYLDNFCQNMINITIPGLLIIDTPGHESFVNLRNRGSSICDMAILIVDIHHGIEQQTKESLSLLKQKKCPFIIALNKIDKLYGWVHHKNINIEQCLASQSEYTKNIFQTRIQQILLELAEQSINAKLFYENNQKTQYISIVPTSAITGEGLPDLLSLGNELIQKYIEKQITHTYNVQCTVLEVKHTLGLGVTIDVILVNGTLYFGDKIVLCGLNGPVVTKVKKILIPHPLTELRIKGEYESKQHVNATMCVKIAGDELEQVIPGSRLLVASEEANLKDLTEEVMEDLQTILSHISDNGISVQSSTLGSLEAILIFLKEMKIPVNYIGLGPLFKKHLVNVANMKEKNPRYAVVLAFDIEIQDDAIEFAKKINIPIFTSKVIYHLFDQLKKYMYEYNQAMKTQTRNIAIFPVSFEIIEVFHKKNPIIVGCKIKHGHLHKNTPLCIRNQTEIIGTVISIQINKKDIEIANPRDEVAIKIQDPEKNVSFGRQINMGDVLCSAISRQSIDALKNNFQDEMTNDDWELIIKLKKEQSII